MRGARSVTRIRRRGADVALEGDAELRAIGAAASPASTACCDVQRTGGIRHAVHRQRRVSRTTSSFDLSSRFSAMNESLTRLLVTYPAAPARAIAPWPAASDVPRP